MKPVTLSVLALLAIAGPAHAATYSVSKSGDDNNSCSSAQGTGQGQQKRTIPAGLRCLTVPGDTLLIHGGTYVERLFEVDFGATGTSWSSPMTVAAYPGENVQVSISQGGDNAMRFQNGSVHHVIIRDLIFDGAGGADEMTLAYLGSTSHHIRLENVTLRNSQGNGILGYGADHEFLNITVHHNGMFAGYAISNGMYMTTDRSIVKGGRFYDNECYGIRFWDSDNSHDSTGNVIDGAEIYGNGLGIAFGGASVCGAGGGGVTLADVGNVVKNSKIYGNYYGIEFFHYQTILDAQIYNNTIVNNQIIGLYIPYEAKNTTYRNNIVYGNGSNISDGGVGSVSSTNLVTNPLFINAGTHDYHLQPASPARSGGTTVASVAVDFEGTSRTGAAYDIGAYKYGTAADPVLLAVPAGLTIGLSP